MDADRLHLCSEHDLAAGVAHVGGERLRHGAIVGDPGLRRVEPGDAGGVRLDLAQLVPLEPAKSRNAVRRRTALELAQPRDLGLVERDHELPALPQRDVALVAVRAQQLDAAAAEPRLERPWRVVDAGVHDAAVATCLVHRDLALLLEHGDGRVRLDLRQPPRHGEPDDPRADHADPHRCHASHRNARRPSSSGWRSAARRGPAP